MPKFVAVNNTAHKDLKVQEDRTFSHFKSQHIASLVVHEFARAAQDYPIIFVKDNETGQFRAAAMLGLKPGQNLFYSQDGWKAQYRPESILGYPFVLAEDKNNKEQKILVIDEECERLNTKEGQAFFDEKGEQTKFISNIGNFLSEHLLKQEKTQEFIKILLEYKIIVQQTLEISISGKENQNIDGIYIISEDGFNKLSDKQFLELRKHGFLPAIYSQLLSMARVGSLVKMADKIH
ncbi:MAG: multidrug transporter [Kangiella sp.]|nr:MAG: multidrug transporter [Kangiella sp.]